jgi:N-formylglutamate deformylase
MVVIDAATTPDGGSPRSSSLERAELLGQHSWLEVQRADAPLIVCFPHTGTEIPQPIEARFVTPWLARKDADHWVHLLYDFAHALGATTLRTRVSRSVIDVNRDPSGASLYPGQNTTDLCPLTTFDGELLYKAGQQPSDAEILERRERFFAPYHAAVSDELARLRKRHARVVLYDAHAIPSVVPRLFAGVLPQLNIGDNAGTTCDRALTAQFERRAEQSDFSWICNGRFKGGWTTRHYGRPEQGVHAIQLELACRGYMIEPALPSEANWPAPYDPQRAAALKAVLVEFLRGCLDFAGS